MELNDCNSKMSNTSIVFKWALIFSNIKTFHYKNKNAINLNFQYISGSPCTLLCFLGEIRHVIYVDKARYFEYKHFTGIATVVDKISYQTLVKSSYVHIQRHHFNSFTVDTMTWIKPLWNISVTNDHGYFLFIVNTSRSFPRC